MLLLDERNDLKQKWEMLSWQITEIKNIVLRWQSITQINKEILATNLNKKASVLKLHTYTYTYIYIYIYIYTQYL